MQKLRPLKIETMQHSLPGMVANNKKVIKLLDTRTSKCSTGDWVGLKDRSVFSALDVRGIIILHQKFAREAVFVPAWHNLHLRLVISHVRHGR
jgi:hypothetical protein